MSIAKDIFKIIDSVLKGSQNKCPLAVRESELIVTKDIVYNTDNPEVCLLDTYCLPDSEFSAKKPVLLYIHGGGFVAGGKQYRCGVANWYASCGIYVVNINYGLCPDYKFPEPLKHIVMALEWVCKNADNFNLDMDKIMVSGDSAGAYYAAMLCVACNSDRMERIVGVPKIKIGAAILNCGLYDLDIALKNKLPLNIDKKIFEYFTGFDISHFEDYEYADAVSPIHFVDGNFPHTFLVYSQKDIFCKGQAERFIEELAKSRVHYESYSSVRLLSNHCFSLNWKEENAVKANDATIDFVNRFLRGEIKRPRRRSAKPKILLSETQADSPIANQEIAAVQELQTVITEG